MYGKLDAPGTPCPARSPRSCCSVQLEPGRTRRLRVGSCEVGKTGQCLDGWMGLCGDRSDSIEQTEGRGESFGVDFPVPMAGWRGLTRSLRRLHVRRFALTARKRATTRVVASYVAATPARSLARLANRRTPTRLFCSTRDEHSTRCKPEREITPAERASSVKRDPPGRERHRADFAEVDRG